MTTLVEVEDKPEVGRRSAVHRADIQGLRAVAVVSVLLYHTELGPSGGFIGVDVFFVISGFLITGLLRREHERTGRISLPAFWGRRARRLLPAGVLVIVFTCVTARLFLPASRWVDIGHDAIAAAGYALNWRLAARSVNYLNADTAPGPLQHYWSLAIEEQFYLVWPLLMLLVLRARSRRVTMAAIGLVLALSCALALTLTGPQTYFTTQTRAWELAAGALCAVSLPAVPLAERSPRLAGLAAALSWTGLALIGVAWVVVKPATTWPGPWTVLVVAASVLVLRYGQAGRGAKLLLALPVMTWFGDISYPLYLWHWPLVVLAARNDPNNHLTKREGLAIVVVSIVLAWLTHIALERPVLNAKRFSAPRISLIGGLVLSLIAAGSGVALAHSHSVKAPKHAAGATIPVQVQKVATALAPRPEDAPKDLPDLYGRGCEDGYHVSDVRPCVFDYSTSRSSPVVVAVGDSKMAQWTPALQAIASQKHWKLISLTKSSCPFSDIKRTLNGDEYTSCEDWNQNVLGRLPSLHPDVLFTSELDFYPTIKNGKTLTGAANRQEMIRGLTTRLNQVKADGIPVVAMAETPRMNVNVPDCVSSHLHDLAFCARNRDKALQNAGVIAAAARKVGAGAVTVDMTSHICTPAKCPAVSGNVLIYWDDLHLTATYSRSLAPFIQEALTSSLDPGLRTRLGLT